MTTKSYKIGKNIIVLTLLTIISVSACSCKKNEAGTQQGYATGKITDTKGQPIPGVEVAIENTLVGYHSTANGVTDSKGLYKIKVSNVGTFHASAYLNKTFNGKQYKLELHCDDNDAFGNEGAVRDFQWRLTGEKPVALDGYYGSTIELYNEPGYYINEANITLTLIPIGNLIDGSAGTTLTKRPIVTSYGMVHDIPLGKYTVSATYNGVPLRLKKLDSNQAYSNTMSIEFEQYISTGTPIARISYNQ
ncbi:carboxypeptidase-like regulatory domain-containing protein [Pedobacter frigoris]|uniref:Carboxypeptidase regulatory-like domain-containing protein n=1 Tax=Pedobacter frigoris TaxID=2571272 RepID=A0A4U1CKB0_9SPHI|nr:carboxypeptidase-like regulatory domain-containing protein [Pedobacter frigoris]TKC07470.1 carboxypeptidase regulatory-like domain-containing protein [Pedobacter frigoris]